MSQACTEAQTRGPLASGWAASGTKSLAVIERQYIEIYTGRSERTEDDLQFGASEPLGDTLMSAIAEPERRSRGAMKVETVRVGEDVLVPVGGLGGGDDSLAGFDELM